MSRLIGYIPPIHTEELPMEESEHEEVKLNGEDCAEEAPAPRKTARKKQSE